MTVERKIVGLDKSGSGGESPGRWRKLGKSVGFLRLRLLGISIVLVVVVMGGYLGVLGSRRAYAGEYAAWVIKVYDQMTEVVGGQVVDLMESRAESARALSESMASIANQGQFGLYESRDWGGEIENKRGLVEEIGRLLSEVVLLRGQLEERRLPEGGEDLRLRMVELVGAEEVLLEELQDFNEYQLELMEAYGSELAGVVSEIGDLVVEPEKIEFGEYATYSRKMERLVNLSESALKRVEMVEVVEGFDFLREYYDKALRLNVQEGGKLAVALNNRDRWLLGEISGKYHESYYGLYINYWQGILGYFDRVFWEEGLVDELVVADRRMLGALDNYIEKMGINVVVPEKSFDVLVKEDEVVDGGESWIGEGGNGELEEIEERYYIDDSADYATFMYSYPVRDREQQEAVLKIDFELVTPRGGQISKMNCGELGVGYSEGGSYKIFRVNPVSDGGFWTMKATGSGVGGGKFLAAEFGSDIRVKMEVMKPVRIGEPIVVLAYIGDPKPIDNVAVSIEVGTSYLEDDRGVMELERLVDIGVLGNMVSEELLGNGLSGVKENLYLGLFEDTSRYGTYCFRGKASWPHESGELIERVLLGDCVVIEPSS